MPHRRIGLIDLDRTDRNGCGTLVLRDLEHDGLDHGLHEVHDLLIVDLERDTLPVLIDRVDDARSDRLCLELEAVVGDLAIGDEGIDPEEIKSDGLASAGGDGDRLDHLDRFGHDGRHGRIDHGEVDHEEACDRRRRRGDELSIGQPLLGLIRVDGEFAVVDLKIDSDLGFGGHGKPFRFL